MTTTELESRVLAMEAEITELKERLARSELESDVRISEAQFQRGECMPVDQAIEMLRHKQSAPAK
jgi:hypothetical protein